MSLNLNLVDDIITSSIKEDIGFGDITTAAIFTTETGSGKIIAKDNGVIAGLPVAEAVWKKIDPEITFNYFVKDSDSVKKKQEIAEVKGRKKSLLTGERLSLNFLQRLSGIATLTSTYAQKITSYKAQIVDTRKTTPNLRVLEKYAVKKGGGVNHRFRLDNSVMIKDNHIWGCGSITAAVEKVKNNIPFTTKIEVETKNLKEVKEALNAKVDIIMLDNMEISDMKEAVNLIDDAAVIEASGGITHENIAAIAAAGVDYISVGELTHSPRALDLSFLF